MSQSERLVISRKGLFNGHGIKRVLFAKEQSRYRQLKDGGCDINRWTSAMVTQYTTTSRHMHAQTVLLKCQK